MMEHERGCHLSTRILNRLRPPDDQMQNIIRCDGCLLGKATKQRIKRKNTTTQSRHNASKTKGNHNRKYKHRNDHWEITHEPDDVKDNEQNIEKGEEISSDICGPVNQRGRLGQRYVVNFIDRKTGYSTARVITAKSEFYSEMKRTKAMYRTQHNITLKRLRLDKAGENISDEVLKEIRDEGIKIDTTSRDTSAHNGRAERHHRTMFDMIRAIRVTTEAPAWLWPDIYEHANNVYNTLTTANDDNRLSKYEAFTGKKPNLQMVKIWGCDCFLHTQEESKIEPRARRAVFIGIDEETIGGYKVFDIERKKWW